MLDAAARAPHWLGNLQRGSEHPEPAVRCFDWEAARVADPAEWIDRARRFERVLDARGLYVEMDDVPDEAAPDDVTRVVPLPNNLPDFGLVRRGELAFPTRTLHLMTRARETAREDEPRPEAEELGAAVLAFGPGGALARPEGPKITHGFDPGAELRAARPAQGDDPDADLGDSRE